MNIELEKNCGNREEDNIQTRLNFNGCQNEIDIQFECKLEIHSEGEDEQECISKQQITEKYVGVEIKNESTEPKGATEDESMAVEALRQLGGMFESVPLQPPPPVVPEATAAPFRQHICSICGDSFERKSDLGNHIVCHQVDRPHACRICGNLFRRKADLQNHMMCHQVERPHRCSHCGADFQRPSSLTNHMKIHMYFPGRALLPSGTSVLSSYFPAAATAQSIQPISDKVSVLQVSSYNGWDSPYTCETNCVTISEGNMLSHNENNETPVTSSNHELNYESVEPKHYSQITNISGNISEFDYAGNSGPVIESVQTLQGQQCNIVTYTAVSQHGSENQSEFDIGSFSNVTQDGYMTRNCSLGYSSEGYGDAAVKVELVPYISVSSTEETYACSPVTEHPELPVDTGRPHVCRHCGIRFARGKALESHARLHQDHWGSPVECDKCEEMFPEDISLRQHQETCLGKAVGTSPQHQQQQQDTQTFNTKPCSVIRSSDIVQPAKIGKHTCTECEKRFTTKQKLFRHMWIHRKRPHVCEVCGISLADRGTLDEHRRTQHPGNSPFTCNECGKSFASRQGLWEHSRMHGGKGSPGSSPFLCQCCGKSFASRQGHLIHTRTHTGERPYGCRFCWKAFRDGGTLRKHERIHTGERPHVCPLCPRAFNQKVVLREHVRWVHAARNLDGCQLCGYVVADREALCAHIVKHSDQLAAAVKAAKGKVEPSKSCGALNVLNRVHQTEPPTSLPAEHDSTNYAFMSSDGLPLQSPHSDMISMTVPEIKTEYTCDMCHEVFEFRTELLDHVRIHI